MYVVLCAEPGIGKDLVINPVVKFLRFHKRAAIKEEEDGETKVNGSIFAPNNYHKSKFFSNDLIATGANATTHQALILSMSNAYTGHTFFNHEKNKPDVYRHSSLTIQVTELASLFRKHTEDLARFFLEAFDCKDDYRYETISRNTDIIMWPCLNLLAGTTPSFFKSVLDNQLLDEGFSARAVFVCAKEARFRRFIFPETTEHQKEAVKGIQELVLNLSKVYGRCVYSKDATDYVEDYCVNFDKIPRPNPNPKLKHYYAKKSIHLQKLAMVHHFSELHNLEHREISLASVKFAREKLDETEKLMHLALVMKTDSKLSKKSTLLETSLHKENRPLTKREILVVMWDELEGLEEVDALVESMKAAGKLAEFTKDEGRTLAYGLPSWRKE